MPETQFPYPTTCEPFGSVIVALHRAVSTFPERRVAAALLVITIEALPVKLAGCAAFADMLVSSPANAQANIAIIAIYSLHIYIFFTNTSSRCQLALDAIRIPILQIHIRPSATYRGIDFHTITHS